jgi:hypothetical protein
MSKQVFRLDSPKDEETVTEEEFVIAAIRELRREPYKGIHSVYSGFNEAFRRQFGKDPVEVTTRMRDQGKIIIRPSRNGVMLYLPEDQVKPLDPEEVRRRVLASVKKARRAG